MRYYVYGLFDPNGSGDPFYIGKGTGDRARYHLARHAAVNENKRKAAKIAKIRRQGFEPIVIMLAEGMGELEAYALEVECIAYYGRYKIDKGGCLMNICADNRPPSASGRKVTPETREKIGDAQRGELNHRYGVSWDEEQKELRRQFNLENGIKPPVRSGPMSEEQKAAIGAGNRGKKRTPEQSAYLSSIRKGKPRGPMSEETKLKIAAAQAGKPRRKMTDEEKAAHSARIKANWARRKGETPPEA